MNYGRILVARALACLMFCVAPPAFAQDRSLSPDFESFEVHAAVPVTDPKAFISEFMGQKPDHSRGMHVTGFSFERDAARFTLEDGDLWFLTPVQGRVMAAIFTGTGTFSVVPPTAFEQAELARFCGAPTLERRLQTLIIVFADTTFQELHDRFPATDRRVPGAASEHLRWFLRSVGSQDPLHLDWGMAWPFLNGWRNRFFSAYILCEGDQLFFFEIDPLRYEEVSLRRVPPVPFLTPRSLERRTIVCRFPSGGQYDTSGVGDIRPYMVVRDYRIDCVISPVLGFSATADLQCRIPVENQTWIPLRLFHDLVVDSVFWDGVPAAFVRDREVATLWVRPPTTPGPNEDHVLRVVYRGHLFESVGDWITLRSTVGWYPRPLSTHDATFNLRFRSPSGLLLRSVGEEVSRETLGKTIMSEWAVRRPTTNATFMLGRFHEVPFGTDETPPVLGLIYRGKPTKVIWEFGPISMVMGGKLKDWVVQDVAKCVAFYQSVLGPAQVPSFVVGQLPGLQGEAFPGLINIPETPFSGPTGPAEDQVFRSHEVAHQWWGYTVARRSYHDHWLEEGFSNFFALWYLQSGLQRGRDYLAVLEKWRDQLFKDSEHRPEGGRPAGPIWLGYRNSSDERPHDYVLVDYKKGAWVLQMLRIMLLDLETMDESRFTGLMQEFYRAHAGKVASTEDFRRFAEHHAGEDLGWFFEQWVYGTGLPTYRFSWHSERTPEGKYRVACRVEQSGVPSGFRTPIVMRVEFGSDRFAWVRRMVEGNVCHFDLPLLPMAPTRILFNDMASVLGKVKNVSW